MIPTSNTSKAAIVAIAFALLLSSSTSWAFALSPAIRFRPLTPEEQKIEKDVMKYGYPDVAMLRYRTDYVLSYDGRTRTVHWVCEHLNADKLRGEANRKKSRFKEDDSIPVEFRSTLDDYRRSGFDRGHKAPARDHVMSQIAMDDTFYLSNMAPQVGIGFNRDYWGKLEQRIRDWAQTRDIYVYTGPLYLPQDADDGKKYVRYQVIGENAVAVPTHFYKVVLAESKGKIEVLAFVLPNQKIPKETPLTDFIVSVDDVERMSGLDFFNVLDKEAEDKIEGEKAGEVWQ